MSLISGAEGVSTDRQVTLLGLDLHEDNTDAAPIALTSLHPCRCIKLSIVHDVAEGKPSYTVTDMDAKDDAWTLCEKRCLRSNCGGHHPKLRDQ